jgi:pimeloyl-ACP methyl ester carboxylesterase
MADIFISYSKSTASITESLAAELEAKGFTVWWDTALAPGDRFSDVILSELADARAVIVIWSSSSVKSDWVLAEARRAREARKLIPVRTEDVTINDIPPPFDVLHTELVSDRRAIGIALSKLGLNPAFGEQQKHLKRDHLVLLVHGINTYARWMDRLKPHLRSAGLEVSATSFGKFGIPRFLSPLTFLRKAAVDRVLADVDNAIDIFQQNNGSKPEKVSIISHSFGTYIVSQILANHAQYKWHRIIFCGSVIRDDYKFDKAVRSRFDGPLLNEVGSKDYWPVLAESAGWGYGSVGSNGFNNPAVETRWHEGFRHSDFFTPRFCQKFWVPFLLKERIEPADEAPENTPLWIRLVANLPLRWILLASIIGAPAFAVFLLLGGTESGYCAPIRFLTNNGLGWNC